MRLVDAAPLELVGIGHRFGDDAPWLFQGVSIELRAGEMVALAGPSGSGKSTLLGIIAAQISPVQGEIVKRKIQRVGWVFQNPFGVPGRTALDHVSFPLLAAGHTIASAEYEARQLLDEFHLGHRCATLYESLSGGEAQRLMLARAIAASPDLLLIDEPTAQLDLHTAKEVARSMQALAGRSTIVLIATHDEMVKQACERLIDLGDCAA